MTTAGAARGGLWTTGGACSGTQQVKMRSLAMSKESQSELQSLVQSLQLIYSPHFDRAPKMWHLIGLLHSQRTG